MSHRSSLVESRVELLDNFLHTTLHLNSHNVRFLKQFESFRALITRLARIMPLFQAVCRR
jgi:hypothetical protein